jgi:hypothetical protein
MSTSYPTLPTLTVNRQFMMDFIAQEAPCCALGLGEVEGSQCAMIVLRLNLVVASSRRILQKI